MPASAAVFTVLLRRITWLRNVVISLHSSRCIKHASDICIQLGKLCAFTDVLEEVHRILLSKHAGNKTVSLYRVDTVHRMHSPCCCRRPITTRIVRFARIPYIVHGRVKVVFRSNRPEHRLLSCMSQLITK